MKKNKTLDSTIGKTIFSFIGLLILFSQIMVNEVCAKISIYGINLSNVPPGHKQYDLESDGKADLWLFNNGLWKIRKSSDAQLKTSNFGTTGDIPVPEYYSPSSTYDIAVWRPSNATWYRPINDTEFVATQFGLSTDKPVPWDYDGDNRTDIAVFRDGVWYVLKSSDGTVMYRYWGIAGDIPVVGNFFLGAAGDFTVFRPSNSTWYSLNSRNNSTKISQFGTTGDKIVPADYDGDGILDFAVFRPIEGSSSIWWILRSSDNEIGAFDFGVGTDIPVPADYDGDNEADFAVYRPSNYTWFIYRSTNCDIDQFVFGNSGDTPVQNILYR